MKMTQAESKELLAAVTEVEQILATIEERHLYADGQKLSRLKERFKSWHSKLAPVKPEDDLLTAVETGEVIPCPQPHQKIKLPDQTMCGIKPSFNPLNAELEK